MGEGNGNRGEIEIKLDFFSKRIIAKIEALYRNNFKPAFDLYTKHPLPLDSGIAPLMPKELNNDFKVWLLWLWGMPECEFIDDYERKIVKEKWESLRKED